MDQRWSLREVLDKACQKEGCRPRRCQEPAQREHDQNRPGHHLSRAALLRSHHVCCQRSQQASASPSLPPHLAVWPSQRCHASTTHATNKADHARKYKSAPASHDFDRSPEPCPRSINQRASYRGPNRVVCPSTDASVCSGTTSGTGTTSDGSSRPSQSTASGCLDTTQQACRLTPRNGGCARTEPGTVGPDAQIGKYTATHSVCSAKIIFFSFDRSRRAFLFGSRAQSVACPNSWRTGPATSCGAPYTSSSSTCSSCCCWNRSNHCYVS